MRNEFLERLKSIILENISNEQFGVSQLAESVNMSRSSLLRKIKQQADLSASQFIRQVKLEKSKELLRDSDMTISEIAFEVGFANVSYYIKCFREDFGIPPGELRKKAEALPSDSEVDPISIKNENPENKKSLTGSKNLIIIIMSGLIIALIGFQFGSKAKNDTRSINDEKSIAILPFKNMSQDSSNFYFVNGLMESSLNNLQKIEDLRVISRTSVEKYRSSVKTIAEISDELNVAYLVEGSGQKLGDQVMLNINLIDAKSDTPIWTQQYKHQIEDVFELQNTIAKKIALAIQATVTPEELALIDKTPTQNLEAYDFYLQGLEKMQLRTEESMSEAIALFELSVKEDPEFALAYAQIAISYFYIDQNKFVKTYSEKLNENADKALLYDSKSDLSLIAKALFYVSNKEFNSAVKHLEKASEYNPNSAAVVLFLADLYARAIPNTTKYIEYALKGIKLKIEAGDSISRSFSYLHLSNALIQTGFVEEAQVYMDKCLDYYPNNYYAPYLKAYIDYAVHLDIGKTTAELFTEFQKDTNRLEIIQEVAKLYYYQKEYTKANEYYDRYNTLIEDNKVDIYPHESLKMAISAEKVGSIEKSRRYLERYKDYCLKDQTIYKEASKAILSIYEGKNDEAIKQFQDFAKNKDFQYWMILFLEKDPLMKKIESHPQFEETMRLIKDGFWENHSNIKKMLQENNLL